MRSVIDLYIENDASILASMATIFFLQVISLLRQKASIHIDRETQIPELKNHSERAVTSRLKTVLIGLVATFLARELATSVGINELPTFISSFLSAGTMLVIGYLPTVLVGMIATHSVRSGNDFYTMPVTLGYFAAAFWWGAFWLFVFAGAAGITVLGAYSMSPQFGFAIPVMGIISVGSVLYQLHIAQDIFDGETGIIAIYLGSFMTAVSYTLPLLVAAAVLGL